MKKITGILIILLSMSCSQKNITRHNFDWLIGSWIRTNDKEGNITYEHWTKISDGDTEISFTFEKTTLR